MQNEAWLDEINRIVSFHEISDSRYYSAEDHDFWQVIVGLIVTGQGQRHLPASIDLRERSVLPQHGSVCAPMLDDCKAESLAIPHIL